MENVETIVLIVVVLAIVAAAVIGWSYWHGKRRETLKRHFGPEYGRAVQEHGSEAKAIDTLEAPAKRARTAVALRNRSRANVEYWSGFNVTLHHRFTSPAESLDYFHWRNQQYPGYIELMPVSGQGGKVVLDYGCGPGHDVIGFGVCSVPKRLLAADISPTSLAEAEHRSRLHGLNVEFIRIDEVTEGVFALAFALG